MIPMIEDALQQKIQARFQYLKENPLAIKDILNINSTRLDNLIKTMATRPVIPVIKGYPNMNAVSPVICIFLGDESEESGGLGDYGYEDHHTHETTVKLKVKDAPMTLPANAIELVSVKHVRSGQLLSDLDFGYDLGLGRLEIYNSTIATGDLIEVTFLHDRGEGEVISAKFHSSYRIEVWTDNGDDLVDLYNLLKWALLSSRKALGKDNEVLIHSLRGSDVQFRSDYFPNLQFKRSLSYDMEHYESALDPDEKGVPQYADSIEVFQKEYE